MESMFDPILNTAAQLEVSKELRIPNRTWQPVQLLLCRPENEGCEQKKKNKLLL